MIGVIFAMSSYTTIGGLFAKCALFVKKTERVISSSGNRKKIDIWMFAILFWMEESNLLDNSC